MASCTMNCVGRLAQRLERSVYTRKVVRSNRTVPTIRAQHRITLSGDVVQLVRTLPRHWLESYTVTAVLLLGVIINIYRPTKACSSPIRSLIRFA